METQTPNSKTIIRKSLEQRNGLMYVYHHFPRLRVIVVDKGTKQSVYRLFMYGARWVCDPLLCPGSRWHGYCHHETWANHARFVSVPNEPWVEWAEDLIKENLMSERRQAK